MVFVFDENVFLFSYTLDNERGEEDTSSADLAISLIQQCWKFALDLDLFRKYSTKADWIEATGKAVSGISLLSVLMTNTAKLEFKRTEHQLIREEEIPEDDRPIARLAASSSATLITTDDRLRERLTDSSVAKANKLRILRPEVALHLIRDRTSG